MSGEVLVRNGSLLDREMRAVYYATLQATDGAHLTGSTLLEIALEDDNDNAPVVTGTYKVFVVEDQEDVSVQIQVKRATAAPPAGVALGAPSACSPAPGPSVGPLLSPDTSTCQKQVNL